MRISIVTPSYNQALFVEETILSVLSQDYSDVEYIVVDGCSDDGTIGILEKYRHRLSHLIVEPDDGQADAIAKGFKRATGDICAYLNSDDVLLPGTLRFINEFFAHNPKVDCVYSHRVFIDSNSNVTDFWILPPHSDVLMKRWDYIPQETCFWRTSLMRECGGIDPGFQFALDYDFFVRAMRHGRFKRASAFLGAFRVHDSSKTVSSYNTVGTAEVDKVRRKYGLSVDSYWRVIERIFFWIVHCASLIARKILIKDHLYPLADPRWRQWGLKKWGLD